MNDKLRQILYKVKSIAGEGGKTGRDPDRHDVSSPFLNCMAVAFRSKTHTSEPKRSGHVETTALSGGGFRTQVLALGLWAFPAWRVHEDVDGPRPREGWSR